MVFSLSVKSAKIIYISFLSFDRFMTLIFMILDVDGKRVTGNNAVAHTMNDFFVIVNLSVTKFHRKMPPSLKISWQLTLQIYNLNYMPLMLLR